MEGALKGTDVVSKNSFVTAAGGDPDSRSVYNTAFLIHCVSVASNLRKDKDLLTAAKKALKLVVPPHILAAIEEHATMSCPDKATISRFRMSLDVGWMLTMRKFNSVNSDMDLLELPARWMSLDKSEQAGVNWLIVIYRQVAPYDLEPVAENIDKLCEFYNAAVDAVMAEAEETGDDPDIASIVVDSEIKEMEEFIGHSVFDHMLPPAGTGSRRGGLLYTLRALFHVIRLQTWNTIDFKHLLKSIISTCSDWGTEFAANDSKEDAVKLIKEGFTDAVSSSSASLEDSLDAAELEDMWPKENGSIQQQVFVDESMAFPMSIQIPGYLLNKTYPTQFFLQKQTIYCFNGLLKSRLLAHPSQCVQGQHQSSGQV